MYFHATPAENSKELQHIFLNLEENGIVRYLTSQLSLHALYSRARERVVLAYLSRRRLPEHVVPWAPQQLSDEKFKHIFVLWGMYLLVSLLILIQELIRHRYKVFGVRKIVRLPGKCDPYKIFGCSRFKMKLRWNK